MSSSKSKKNELYTLAPPKTTKQHIRRFDNQEKDVDSQEKKDDGIITSISTTTEPSKATKEMPSSKSQKRKKKRKRTASATTTTSSSDDNKMIFNGLILALSTDNKVHQSNTTDNSSTKSCTTTTTTNKNNNNEDDQYETLKSLKTILKSHGATISPQVHKRVHYLICTSSAITNLTQRIRQAIKRNVDIVSVDWVRRCIEEGRRVDVGLYGCNEIVGEIMLDKEREIKVKGTNNSSNAGEGYESDIPQDDNRGWSEPIQLDCCCVCHENGDDNCPWCVDCNINLAKKRKKETT